MHNIRLQIVLIYIHLLGSSMTFLAYTLHNILLLQMKYCSHRTSIFFSDIFQLYLTLVGPFDHLQIGNDLSQFVGPVLLNHLLKVTL